MKLDGKHVSDKNIAVRVTNLTDEDKLYFVRSAFAWFPMKSLK